MMNDTVYCSNVKGESNAMEDRILQDGECCQFISVMQYESPVAH